MSLTFPNIKLSVCAGFQLIFLFLIFFAFSGTASAQVFSNTSAITINDNSPATPYPSNINVSGVGTVYKVSLTLNGLSHTFPNDISMMLVAPNGTRFVFMSSACNSTAVSNLSITFDDAAAAALPSGAVCTSGAFRPRATTTATFPSPATNPATADYATSIGSATFASKFSDINANGTWSLYVRDNANSDIGSISGGWSIAFNTYSNASTINLPDNANASVYPSTVNVVGFGNYVGKVTLRINGLTHTYVGDLGMMLVAPNGLRFIFMSRTCGDPDVSNITINFDDAAATTLPDFGPCVSGTFRPSVAGTSIFPAPAPAFNSLDYAGAGGATFANKFTGIDPNGTWSLYIRDNAAGDSGSIARGWSLSIAPTDVTAAPASITGRVSDANGRGISNARVKIADTVSGEARFVATNPFGFYQIPDLSAGNAYIITVEHKRYTFQNNPRLVQLFEDQDIQFIAEAP